MPAREDGGRVVVARGGRSLEREISLRSGHRAEHALRDLGFDVHSLDPNQALVSRLKELEPRFVFVAMHGRGGEDGTLQDLLEILRVPYTGSDVHTSALCMDKIVFKELLRQNGLPTPASHSFNVAAFSEFGAAETLPELMAELGLPLVVKPAGQGSSIGIKFLHEESEFPAVLLGAFNYDDRVLIEKHVAGRELAVTVLGPPDAPRALPIVELVAAGGFYDFDAHYEPGVAELRVPAELGEATRRRVEEVATGAYSLMGCRDFARVDMVLDAGEEPQILEINTIPGLTETGPTPRAAAAAGMAFEDFVDAVIGRVAGATVTG